MFFSCFIFLCFCSKVSPLFLKFYKVNFTLVFLFSCLSSSLLVLICICICCWFFLAFFSFLDFVFVFHFVAVKIFALYKLIYLSIIVICIFVFRFFNIFLVWICKTTLLLLLLWLCFYLLLLSLIWLWDCWYLMPHYLSLFIPLLLSLSLCTA